MPSPRDDEPAGDEWQAEQRLPKQEQADEGDNVGNVMHIPVGAIAMRLLVIPEKCRCIHCIRTREFGGLATVFSEDRSHLELKKKPDTFRCNTIVRLDVGTNDVHKLFSLELKAIGWISFFNPTYSVEVCKSLDPKILACS